MIIISDDSFNQFHFRTTIDYDFDEFKWSYWELGLYKVKLKANQSINHDYS